MGRGRLDPPKLDDRNWQEIRDQALKLISQKCPAWTDRSPSDPGIAIVEMFAWLVEGMIWRLDQVPERNFVEFLNLLGITRDPPVPAMNWLTFTNSTPTTKVVVPEGTQAGTLESSSQTATIFETDESVEVFPGEIAQAWAVQDDSRRPREANDVVKQIVKSPLQGWDVVLSLDGPGEAKESVVSLGLTQVPPANESFSIHVQIANLEGEPDVMPREQFELSVDTQYSGPNASRKSFIPQQDQTNNLLQSGRIVWKSPADWTAVKRSVLNQESPPQSPDLPLFWLDFRLKVTSHVSGGVGSSSRQPKIRLGHMLYNSVPPQMH